MNAKNQNLFIDSYSDFSRFSIEIKLFENMRKMVLNELLDERVVSMIGI